MAVRVREIRSDLERIDSELDANEIDMASVDSSKEYILFRMCYYLRKRNLKTKNE